MNSDDYEGGFNASDIEAMLSRISSDFRGWVEGFVPLAIGSADPSAVDRLARSFLAMDPRVAYALARMIFLGDQREVLDHVALPSTLVHVPCVGLYMLARMRAARCAAAAMETIDSAGHFPQLVAPDKLLEILNRVLSADDEQPVVATRKRNGNGDVGGADAEMNSSDIGMAP